MTWLKSNLNVGNIITIVTVIVGLAGNMVLTNYRLSYVEEEHAKLANRIESHIGNEVRHVNEKADKQFQDYVKESLGRIEAQVERLRNESR